MTIGETVRLIKEAFTEKVASKDGFEWTSTERCQKLIDQLKPLEHNLKKYVKELKDYEHHSKELLSTTRAVLTVPALLEGGAASPVAASPAGHHHTDLDPMTTERLRNSVILPCEHWLAEYNLVKDERMHVLEKGRLDLDSRRRQEIKLKTALTKVQAKVPPTDPSKHDKHNRQIEQAAQLLAHKQTKLNCSAKSFADQEAAIYQTLTALAHDTALVPSYLTGALTIMKEFFTHAVESFPQSNLHIPVASALKTSNHHDMWRDATSPNVAPPVLPVQPVDPYHSQPTTPTVDPYHRASLPHGNAYDHAPAPKLVTPVYAPTAIAAEGNYTVVSRQ